MNKRQFISARRSDWERFEILVNKLDSSPASRMKGAEATEFSRLFRMMCSDLALIRSRDWGHGLSEYLNDLVSRGHNCFYSAPPGNWGQIWHFLARGFPQVFRANIGFFLAAAALFFLPLGVSWVIVQRDPTLATRVIDANSLEQAEKNFGDQDKTEREKSGEKSRHAAGNSGKKNAWEEDSDFSDQRATMAGFYVMNNVGIALQCFAHGILTGIGTVFILISNGITIGALSGYLIAHGHSERFLSFVVSHGSFELTAIAVAGGGGLMLADALLHPGRRTRLESLRYRGMEAIQIACGAAAMLVVAALIEAFWSPSGVPVVVKYSVGGLLWVLVFLYLGFAGREAAS